MCRVYDLTLLPVLIITLRILTHIGFFFFYIVRCEIVGDKWDVPTDKVEAMVQTHTHTHADEETECYESH